MRPAADQVGEIGRLARRRGSGGAAGSGAAGGASSRCTSSSVVCVKSSYHSPTALNGLAASRRRPPRRRFRRNRSARSPGRPTGAATTIAAGCQAAERHDGRLHRRAGRQAVVDHRITVRATSGALAAGPVLAIAAVQLEPLAGGHLLDERRRDGQVRMRSRSRTSTPPSATAPIASSGWPGHAKLPDEEDVERRVERRGDLGAPPARRHAAGRARARRIVARTSVSRVAS